MQCGISIHAPRTGSDFIKYNNFYIMSYFNPRSPHGERRKEAILSDDMGEFQSTLPARGATCKHLSYGGTTEFQSTLPARGATCDRTGHCRARHISIHAPRTGSDNYSGWRKIQQLHFNPRSPHGERQISQAFQDMRQLFQSTLPARGATRSMGWSRYESIFQSTLPARGATETTLVLFCFTSISIHAPRTGSDRRDYHAGNAGKHFNPRSPHGERREWNPSRRAVVVISIHAPRTGSDDKLAQ